MVLNGEGLRTFRVDSNQSRAPPTAATQVARESLPAFPFRVSPRHTSMRPDDIFLLRRDTVSRQPSSYRCWPNQPMHPKTRGVKPDRHLLLVHPIKESEVQQSMRTQEPAFASCHRSNCRPDDR